MRVLAQWACMLLLVAGCGKEPVGKPDRVTVAQFGHVFLYMPLYVAVNKGYFEQEGLSINLVSTGGDDKTFAAVASGSAQFGVADPIFVAIARAQGQDGKVIGSLVNRVTFWGVAYRQDVGEIGGDTGWGALKVLTYQAPSTNYAVMRHALGGDRSVTGATIVQAAFGTLLAALKSGRADVAMELEPTTSIAVADGAHVVYSAATGLGEFAFTGITVTRAYLEANPEVARKFLRALGRAMDYLHQDFEGGVAVAVAEFPEVPPEVARQALRRLLDEGAIPTSPVLTPTAWENAVALRTAVGDLTSPAPYAVNVDTTFVGAKRVP